MALGPGTRLGPYEIVSALGAGGMGEVYRARDTRLDRIVAIKILPDALAVDPEFRERFDREARTISQLTHPHICTLFDVGHDGGTHYLVLEYLEGQTLADRLAQGPLPLEQALRYAIQISAALDRSHRLGIVHRDLKPANIMLTSSGVKLLDFGLAKVTSRALSGSSLSIAQTAAAPVTMQGTLLGTLPYMAPEQVEGREADARSDIFAFGAILFEMLTGKRAFDGPSQASLIGAILKDPLPPINPLQPAAPPMLEAVVHRCVAKNADERWQSARDVNAMLETLATLPLTPPTTIVSAPSSRSSLRWILAASALLLIALGALVAQRYVQSAPDVREAQFLVDLPASISINSRNMAVSPNGRWIAAISSSSSSIFLRAIDSTSVGRLDGTEGASNVFWSPDNRYLAFFAAGKLKKLAIDGGPPEDVASTVGNSGGGTWNSEGVIVFSMDGLLYRVSATGGTPEPVDVDGHPSGTFGAFPAFLSDGRHFLYLSAPGEGRGIYAASLGNTGTTQVIDAVSQPIAASGYLLYQREGTLFAQPFDEQALKVSGEPVRLADHIAFASQRGAAAFAASSGGVLAFRSGGAAETFQFTWFDRSGRQIGLAGKPNRYLWAFDLSPDGKRIVVSLNGDLWLMEWERDVMTRLTSDPADESDVIWSPDGRQIVFASERSGHGDLFQTSGEPSSEALLLATNGSKWPEDWSHDGRYIAFMGLGGIAALPLFGDRKPFQVIAGPTLNEPHFSFDGKWLAYNAREASVPQIFVAAFPNGDRKRQISSAGGGQPRWRSDGKELYYLSIDGTIMAVDVNEEPTLESGRPHALFETGLPLDASHDQYAVTADGQRFLVRMPVEESAPVTVRVNWAAGLKK